MLVDPCYYRTRLTTPTTLSATRNCGSSLGTRISSWGPCSRGELVAVRAIEKPFHCHVRILTKIADRYLAALDAGALAFFTTLPYLFYRAWSSLLSQKCRELLGFHGEHKCPKNGHPATRRLVGNASVGELGIYT